MASMAVPDLVLGDGQDREKEKAEVPHGVSQNGCVVYRVSLYVHISWNSII